MRTEYMQHIFKHCHALQTQKNNKFVMFTEWNWTAAETDTAESSKFGWIVQREYQSAAKLYDANTQNEGYMTNYMEY